ncbi:hypothetical protein CRC_03138 [Cylindrospermopsis raciborskii CS-505]|nr:hypothetical protein CRC_03138 [Cylindrospermopsis raciborskii CS-505]
MIKLLKPFKQNNPASLWEVESMETAINSHYIVFLRLSPRFPLGSGINGNFITGELLTIDLNSPASLWEVESMETTSSL